MRVELAAVLAAFVRIWLQQRGDAISISLAAVDQGKCGAEENKEW